MFASPYHQVTDSSSVRGIILWMLMCFTVFYVIDDLATRPKPIDVENFRSVGMNDEQVLAMALQEANRHREVAWWINNRETYLVFDTTRDYRISDATFAAFDLTPAQDAAQKPIAVFGQRAAGMNIH
jgi:hypothetical protein